MKVKLNDECVGTEGTWGLVANMEYDVIGIEADYYRIVNNQSGPVLYPPELFEVIDPQEPADWISEFGEEGERYAYPAEMNQPGFFEDYHDGNHEAIRGFWDYYRRVYGQS